MLAPPRWPSADLLASLPLAIALAGCGARARDVARATTTSSMAEAGSRPASSRTIDDSGYVDNGGRPSSETARTEMSGMRASELGSERPTGTPGTGAGIPPRTPAARARSSDELTRTVIARIASARCDRETTCGRSGAGRDTCMMHARPRVQADVDRADCAQGFETVQLGACLTALRQLDCGKVAVALDDVQACRATALCAGP
jgi:hypothetical protein